MKVLKWLTFFIPGFLYCSASGIAQYARGASVSTILTIRSDQAPKSTLLTNIPESGSGLHSPVLIAAAWKENEQLLECRSLLAFDLGELPEPVLQNPRLLQSATLVLHPLQSNLAEGDEQKPGQISICRVKESWNDSALKWESQPGLDSGHRVNLLIKAKERKHLLETDVTRLVAAMLREGNNGFLIGHSGNDPQQYATGEIFASPLHENKKLRPLLVIKYRETMAATPVILRRAEGGGRQQQIRMTPVPGTAGAGQGSGQNN